MLAQQSPRRDCSGRIGKRVGDVPQEARVFLGRAQFDADETALLQSLAVLGDVLVPVAAHGGPQIISGNITGKIFRCNPGRGTIVGDDLWLFVNAVQSCPPGGRPY